MHKALGLAAIAAVGFVGLQQAGAADLRMPVKAAPAPVVMAYNWTGFYVGGNLGWGWANADGTLTINGVPGTVSGDGDGFVGGLQAGYNWQFGAFVFGLETDIQLTGGDGGLVGIAGANRLVGTGERPYFGTIRGRLGFAQDRWLWYVTGGAAYGEDELSGLVNNIPFSSSETWWTYTVGAGLEWAWVDRWTAKVEYLFIGTPNHGPGIPNTNLIDGHVHTHILRAGLNYRF